MTPHQAGVSPPIAGKTAHGTGGGVGETGGQWRVEVEALECDDEDRLPHVYVVDPGTVCDATVVCTIGTHNGYHYERQLEEKLDQARLIAAAPDLLAVLIRCNNALAVMGSNGTLMTDIRAAITKATVV